MQIQTFRPVAFGRGAEAKTNLDFICGKLQAYDLKELGIEPDTYTLVKEDPQYPDARIALYPKSAASFEALKQAMSSSFRFKPLANDQFALNPSSWGENFKIQLAPAPSA